MGLFESIAGQVLGSLSNTGGNNPPSGMLEAIGGLLNNPQTGGLAGLVNAFEQQGLGGVIGSWISTGQNLPISAEQLQSVLGNEHLQRLAQQLGFSPQEVASHLTDILPKVVDGLTPNGTLPEGNAISGLVGLLNKTAG